MLFNQVMRYVPVLNYLLRKNPARVLEVGSGSNGIAPYWQRPLIGCDIRFAEPIHPNLYVVVASATALPFGDHAFDCVCSLDTIEHLRPELRVPALAEMARVGARWVVVAYPAGRSAQRSDRAIQWFYDWRGGAAPDWLGEHFQAGFPNGYEVLDVVRDGGWHLSQAGNENVFAHFLGIVLETRPWFYRNAGDYLRRHAWLIAWLSFAPCYRRLYFMEKQMD